MAAETVPPDAFPWDAPLATSYPPPVSPGTKHATGRPETDGDSYAPAPGPLLTGKWMLKRSEHLKRWNKRWVSLDATGKLLTFRSSPEDAKTLSHVKLKDIRAASVSSVNFHGNKSYAKRCVYVETKHADPESDESKGVFLVAETYEDASRWVADIRALAPDPNSRRISENASLSPAAAPPTPALVAKIPRRAGVPASDSSSAESRASSSSSASFENDAVTPLSTSSRSVSRSDSSGTHAAASRRLSARASATSERSVSATSGWAVAPASRWFVGTKKQYAADLASAAEDFKNTTSQTHAHMAQMQEMMREALSAKDAMLRATQESLACAQTAATESRMRADATAARLEEKSIEVSEFTRELEDVKAAAQVHVDMTRERLAKADANERELRASLASAEARIKALEAEKAAEAMKAARVTDALRLELEAASARSIRAAAEAEMALSFERRTIETLEAEISKLERVRGWKGVFGGARTNSGRARMHDAARGARDVLRFSDSVSFDSRSGWRASADANTTPLLITPNDTDGTGDTDAVDACLSGGTAYRGVSAAAAAATAAAEATTPEAVEYVCRRRLFEYGLAAPSTPAEVISHLDSPGAHGCRQM